MPTYLSDTAIVLRVTDFSETSQVVGVFARTHGLLPLIAKGSKRPSKKSTMSGPLDLLTSGEVVFISPKQTAELGTLHAWELADHRKTLRANLPGLNAAMVAAEVTLRLLQPLDPHPELYDELEAALKLLGGPQFARGLLAYTKAALVAAGYAPQLEACALCGKSLATAAPETPTLFAPSAGGVVCTACSSRVPTVASGRGGSATTTGYAHKTTVPARILIALARLPAPSELLLRPSDRPADPAALSTALELLLSQIEALTDKPLKTRYLLPSLFR